MRCCSHFDGGHCDELNNACFVWVNYLDRADCPVYGGDQYLKCEVGNCDPELCEGCDYYEDDDYEEDD